MLISDFRIHSIAMADPPLRSSYGLHQPYALRNVIELISDDGVIGIAETYGGGRFRFDGDVALSHAGAFGYTVRVLPQHPLLASDAELGVVALPV